MDDAPLSTALAQQLVETALGLGASSNMCELEGTGAVAEPVAGLPDDRDITNAGGMKVLPVLRVIEFIFLTLDEHHETRDLREKAGGLGDCIRFHIRRQRAKKKLQ